MMRLRILADDLTGALDSAAAFSGAVAAPVWLSVPTVVETHYGDAPVQALAIGSRGLPPDALSSALLRALPWLIPSSVGEALPPPLAFKKIDSLVRGNTFAEVAWLVRNSGLRGAVFAPAYPAQGRFTSDGHHWVGPAHQPHAKRSGGPSIALGNAFAEAGLRAKPMSALSLDHADDGQVLLPDVLTDADLATLAALAASPAAQQWLWCGSAGLAWALARHLKLAQVAACPPPHQGRVLAVTASHHPVLRTQLQHLPSHWRSFVPGANAADANDTANAATLAQAASAAPRLLIDLALPAAATQDQAQAHLAAWSRRLVNTLPRPDSLVVVGGDTLLALCEASGANRLLAGSAPRPGWGSAHIDGGRWHRVACQTRSGAFGAPDDLADLLRQWTPLHQKETNS